MRRKNITVLELAELIMEGYKIVAKGSLNGEKCWVLEEPDGNLIMVGFPNRLDPEKDLEPYVQAYGSYRPENFWSVYSDFVSL